MEYLISRNDEDEVVVSIVDMHHKFLLTRENVVDLLRIFDALSGGKAPAQTYQIPPSAHNDFLAPAPTQTLSPPPVAHAPMVMSNRPNHQRQPPKNVDKIKAEAISFLKVLEKERSKFFEENDKENDGSINEQMIVSALQKTSNAVSKDGTFAALKTSIGMTRDHFDVVYGKAFAIEKEDDDE